MDVPYPCKQAAPRALWRTASPLFFSNTKLFFFHTSHPGKKKDSKIPSARLKIPPFLCQHNHPVMVFPVRTVGLGISGKKIQITSFLLLPIVLQLHHCSWILLDISVIKRYQDPGIPPSWSLAIPDSSSFLFPRFQFKNKQQCDIIQQDLLHKQHSNLQINPAEFVFPQNECTETQNENVGRYPGFIGGIQSLMIPHLRCT